MSLEHLVAGLRLYEAYPSADGLQLQPPLSWSIWACLPESPAGSTVRAVFSFSTVAGTGLSGYNLMALNSKLHFYVRVAPRTWYTIPALADVDEGWHHYAGSFSVVDEGGGDYTMYMYFWIDGVLQGSVEQMMGAIALSYAASNQFPIGAYLTNRLHCFVQDFAIWNTDFTTSAAYVQQIAGMKRAGHAAFVHPSNLVGFWTFDEMNNGEDVAVNPKYFYNKSAGTGGAFQPSGTGHLYGGPIPVSFPHSARLVTIDSAGPLQEIAADALTLVSSAQSLVVVPGGVAILMDPATGAFAARPLTIGVGGTTRAMQAIGLTGTPQALQVIPGEYVTALSVITSTGQAGTIATIGGPVTIAVDPSVLVSSPGAIQVTPGEFVTQIAALIATLSPQGIGVIPGATSISLADVALAATIPELTVVPGGVTIDADVLSLVASAQAIVILPGGTSIPLDTLILASQVPVLVVCAGLTIILAPLQLLGSVGGVSIVPGATSIGMVSVGLNVTAQTLQLFAIKLIEMGALVATSTARGLSVLPGATFRGMTALSLASSLPTLDVVPGPIIRTLQSLLLASSATRVLVPRAVTVLLDAITASLQARSAFAIRGFDVVLNMGAARFAATAGALKVIGGTLVLPDGRKIIITAEDRILIIAGEDRVIVVPEGM